MRLNHREITKSKEMRNRVNGFNLDEDEIIDDMDSTAEAQRQIRLIDQRTEKRKMEREKEEKQENENQCLRVEIRIRKEKQQ